MLFKRKKTIQKGELSDINVELVSLLFDDMKPANRKGFVAKSGDQKAVLKGYSIKYKSEETDGEGRIYVTVYEPGVKDAQGDSATAEEIQKACENFSKKGMLKKNDVNHDMSPVQDCYIAQNYILKTEDKAHFPDTKIGAWVQVIKFDNLDSDLWKKVKAGKFNGVSLYGEAEDSANTEVYNQMKSELQKAIEAIKKNDDPSSAQAVKQLQKQLDELEKNHQENKTDDQIKQIQKGFETIFTMLNKAVNIKIKDESEPEEKDRTLIFGGDKVTMKAEKKELYKALADVDSGSATQILTDSLGQQFIDSVIDAGTDDVLTDISVVELGKDESIDKGLIEDIILKNTKDGAADAQAVLTADIDCPTEILTAELELGSDTVEFYKDKKGEAEFGAYVEGKLVAKTKKAVCILLFRGDRASATAKFKGLDGIIKKMTGSDEEASISITDYPTYAERLSAMLQEFSEDALAEIENFVVYVSAHTYLKIQDEIAARKTDRSDGFLLENGKVTFKGMPVKPRNMPDTYYIMGIAKFIILGYRTDVKLKIEHSGSTWKWHWFLRVRFGTAYVPGGLVQMFKEIE